MLGVHAPKSGLRVHLAWKINRPGSVITTVPRLDRMLNPYKAPTGTRARSPKAISIRRSFYVVFVCLACPWLLYNVVSGITTLGGLSIVGSFSGRDKIIVVMWVAVHLTCITGLLLSAYAVVRGCKRTFVSAAMLVASAFVIAWWFQLEFPA
jgi:hypothetical protein